MNITKYSSHLALSGFIFVLALFIVTDNHVYPSSDDTALKVESNSSYWEIGQNMSSARNELAAVLLGDKIYVIGGEDIAAGGSQKDTLEVFDVTKGKWLEANISQMPASLDHTAAATFGGKIYVVGGFHERKTPTNTLLIYDPKTNEWTQGKSLPSARGALSAEFINGTLYAIGGLNSSQVPVGTNEAYDPNSDTWTSRAAIPTPRHHLSTAVVDGKLYALGGRILGNGVPSEDIDEGLSNFDRNEVYDPQSDSWDIQEPMLVKRSGFTAAAFNGYIYAFGGEGVAEVYDSVERYSPLSNSWSFEAPLPTGRMGLKAVTFNDRIYVIGGQLIDQSGLVPLNVNEILHIKNGTVKQN